MAKLGKELEGEIAILKSFLRSDTAADLLSVMQAEKVLDLVTREAKRNRPDLVDMLEKRHAGWALDREIGGVA